MGKNPYPEGKRICQVVFFVAHGQQKIRLDLKPKNTTEPKNEIVKGS